MSEGTCYVAEFHYNAIEADELSLEPGDIILDAKSAPDDGWMTGRKEGTEKSGLFPDNFVTPCHKATMRQQHQRLPPGAAVFVVKRGDQQSAIYAGKQYGGRLTVPNTYLDFDGRVGGSADNNGDNGGGLVEKQPRQSRLVGGVGLGDIFSGKQITLKRSNEPPPPAQPAPVQQQPPPPPSKISSKPGKSAVEPPLPAKPAAVKPQPSAATEDLMVVQHKYVAKNADELSLEPGQVVNVLDRNLEDEGWWRGELNGKIGVFPDNFVAAYQPQTQTAPVRGVIGAAAPVQQIERPLPQPPSQQQPVVKPQQPPPPHLPPKPKDAVIPHSTFDGAAAIAQLEADLRLEIEQLRSLDEERQLEVQELQKFKRSTQQEMITLKEDLDNMTKKYHSVVVDLDRLKREIQNLVLNK